MQEQADTLQSRGHWPDASDTRKYAVRGETADVVYEWNRLVQGAAPNWRAYAMMHIAMFDAANSVADAYTPFRMQMPGARGASQQVAAAQAAHDVLSALFPAQQPHLVQR